MASATSDVATGPRRGAHRRLGGVSTLMYACQQGSVDRVRKIVSEQESLLGRDRTGKTALHYCCTSDSVRAAHAADLLVMAAPELVEGRDEDGFTPLHLAVIAGNMPLVTFLLANRADVNAVDNEKHTVVHWAAVCGETAALRAVLEAGAPVSTPDVHGGYPLHYAAQMCGGDKDSDLGLQVLQTLLSHGDAVVSVSDGDGRQPLLWAASAGSARAVLALVRAGAAAEAPDRDGLTALHCAASRGHTDCIDTLLTLCGAAPDVIDGNGCTALHYAVTLGHADATALLLAHGADPNRQDRKGRSPAHCGCAKGQLETVRMIGARGANLWLRNARGDLPLHEAAASGRRELVRWLLDARPSQVNARNNDGRCPLHLAALNDNVDMCKILLDAGAQINPVLRTSRNTFMTPLDCALQRGLRSTAKYLQLHGGVPAARLGDRRRAPAGPPQAGDDVAFWGDTSSDGEAADRGRLQRKRLTPKYQKKRASLSGSDPEGERGRRAKTTGGQKTGGKAEEIGGGVLAGSASREIEGKVAAELPAEKRPKSAKRGKLESEDGGLRRKTKNERPKVIQKQERVEKAKESESGSGKRRSDEESDENEERRVIDRGSLKEEANGKTLPDQRSLMSNTSDEAEERKDLVVEAAVHEPPKASEEKITKEIDIQTEMSIAVDSEGEKVLKEIQERASNETVVELESEVSTETNVVIEDQVQKEQIQTQETVEITKDKKENNEVQLTKETETEAEKSENKESFTDIDTTKEITDENLIKEEASEIKEQVDNEIKNEEVLESSNQVLTEETLKEEKQQTPEEINVKELTETEKSEKIPDELVDQNKITEADINKNNQQNEIFTEKTADSKLQEDDVEIKDKKTDKKEKSQKSKRKKKHHQRKNEDQPYEIIYKTIGANETVEDNTTEDVISKTQKVRRSRKDEGEVKKSTSESKSSEEDYFSDTQSDTSSTSTSLTVKEHKSFRVLDDQEVNEIENGKRKPRKKSPLKKQRSRSEENEKSKTKDAEKQRRSKIPTSLSKKDLSKSDKYLNVPDRKVKSSMDSRVPSLPDINTRDQPRSESNMSAPPAASVYSDNERGSASDVEEDKRNGEVRKKKVKRRPKTREARSAGSDYESSNVIDSGFEPSPRSSRIPKCKNNMSQRGVNMSSVTQSIQSNIRRYHLERKIFQHLLDLKRMQIRAGQHNEAVLVKRAIDAYHKSCAATVGAGRYDPEDFTFRSFERFLYASLRRLQKNGAEHLRGLPEAPADPLLCTQSTHRCMHATHAYTGIPCAAYLPRMDHHTIPKIGFASAQCKPGTGFLPTINPKKAVTLELCHGNDKQIISLPADRLDQNKRYYVTFTVKGAENAPTQNEDAVNSGHRHSKSD